MQVHQYIPQLLYLHDCVEVPGLGGFVCEHKKLEFNVYEGLLIPARKIPFFNTHLNTNDGLLVQHIVQKQNITAQAALENINAWVGQLHYRLQKGETIVLEGLGTFSLNGDKKIEFIPLANSNFLVQNYGLPALQLRKKEIKSTETVQHFATGTLPPVNEKPTEKKATINTTPAPTLPPQRKKGVGRYLRRVVFMVFTILLFSSFFVLQDYMFHAQSKNGIPAPAKQQPKAPAIHDETDEDANKTNQPDTTTKQKHTDNSLQNSTTAHSNVDTYTSTSSQTDSVFYIIAGAFKSETNAADLSAELAYKGYDPKIINVQGSSLYRVAYRQYGTRKEAESKLNTLRNSTHNFSAWVLSVKQ